MQVNNHEYRIMELAKILPRGHKLQWLYRRILCLPLFGISFFQYVKCSCKILEARINWFTKCLRICILRYFIVIFIMCMCANGHPSFTNIRSSQHHERMLINDPNHLNPMIVLQNLVKLHCQKIKNKKLGQIVIKLLIVQKKL